ncbi:L-histidine N(alpha)-methyltransferase [Pseudoduganella chitinolytica]|uniref:L-histidine N(Alpha)-methyltransferase n=1 Tax=Pseudoduganella chitinolytica TaxID=34070 RepID=A0ABY8BH68_9BURK|nr:L-histidine N(alpha)-methyltransferase [Pseudoduganella chitinolytica]WEF35277.1 L-histidine N(alpha)-methyltransferase [Pseudoduganella chitinolytica]
MSMTRTAALRALSPSVAPALPRTAHGAPATVAEIARGLLARQAATSPKYLYDSLGSRLFEAICELPEYYPTRTEAAIFARHGEDIARRVGTGATLIDLGAGNCAKAASLFPLLRPKQYVPIDISRDFLNEAVSRLRQRFPDIAMNALALDLSGPFLLPPEVTPQRRVFFYPGSSIGNFAPHEAIAFLRRVRENASHDGGLLIGVDLIKDAAVLDAAYDDAIGVTAAFNLNMLRHLNHLVGSDFDVRQWRHVAFFNAEDSRVEMHLEARTALTVRWPGGERQFARGERIHTEDSYKYTRDSFADLLAQAGFHADAVWTDEAGWFAVMHARAASA